ncbi:MAG: rhodanese-related sulfurtransferase, partial [Waterburya sp.]
MSYLIVTFYKFVTLSELETKKAEILALCRQNEIQGTIILAKEGINGTIAGKDGAIATVLAHLRTIPGLADLEHKKSTFQKSPFVRLKVKIKSEIVTLGMPEVNPTQQVGTYVAPQDWNQVISNPEVVLIDTRNDYEVEIGSFQGAKNPKTES